MGRGYTRLGRLKKNKCSFIIRARTTPIYTANSAGRRVFPPPGGKGGRMDGLFRAIEATNRHIEADKGLYWALRLIAVQREEMTPEQIKRVNRWPGMAEAVRCIKTAAEVC